MHEAEAASDTKYIVQQFIWPSEIDVACEAVHEDVRAEWRATLRAAGRAVLDIT